ncbi:phytoene desaturase family protein [Falsibacillus albus]|uniref:Phytoene desaturase n=1 Tax=Falsibacillus albus TaxID=2478915 RepID=A0A3L7K2J6_9BACI|nr:phytoene desaturase family protein [Falsibacillus albus]RLQ97233.1 phytoene desaturase [Falsibacillus albus]
MRVSVAGGGIGGMLAALMLAQDGFEVSVFEKSEKLGGRLAFVNHKGYKIDQGPTIVLLPEMLKQILGKAGVLEKEIDLIPCDPLYKIHFSSGKSYTKYSDEEKQLKEIRESFPGNEAGFLKFMRDMNRRYQIGKPSFLEQSFSNILNFFKPSTLSSLWKLNAHQSVMKQLESYFDNKLMQTAYALQTLYIGGNPFTTPAIYSLVSFSEHFHGIHYLKGGYANLVDILETALKRANVRVHTNHEVTGICRTEGRATSIIANGCEFPTDLVIMNGDFPIVERMVQKNRRRFTASSSCFLIYMGVNKKFEHANVHQFFIGDDFEKNMKEIFKEKNVPSDPSFYVFHPSLIDDSLAPENKGVLYVLVPVPSGEAIEWETEKERFADRIIAEMESAQFSGLRKEIEWMTIRTPQDALADGLYQGGSFGIAPELLQSGPFRPQIKPFKENNIYAVGASIHPGGGIPIVMQGASMLVDAIRKEMDTHVEKKGVNASAGTFNRISNM